MKMVEMGMGEQEEIDGGEMLDFEPGSFDPFEEEDPVREVRIDQDIEIIELGEERCVADPGEGDLALV
jgi:hypothetical protein